MMMRMKLLKRKIQRPWSWLREGMKLTMTLNGEVAHQHEKENKGSQNQASRGRVSVLNDRKTDCI